jgi:hypothetical protein
MLLTFIFQGVEAANFLIINQTDGNSICFKLADKPVITLHDGNLIVTSQNQQISTSLSNLKDYRLTENPTSIKGVETKSFNEVGVYNLNGVKIDIKVNEETLSELKQGIYIVKTATKIYKFIKK